MSVRIAVKAAQRLLDDSGKSVVVDGVWGRKSERAYVTSSAAVQNLADKVVKDLGYDLDDIRNSVSASALISPDQMFEIISRVSSQTGVGAGVLQKFVDLEAARVAIDGVRYYVADAVNRGGYRGLFQFDARGNAWADASKKGNLPAFASSWKDPYLNTLAAAYYVLFNFDILKRRGYKGEMTGAIAYLMHNQGAAGAYRILTGRGKVAGNQSRAAMSVIADAVKEFNSFA